MFAFDLTGEWCDQGALQGRRCHPNMHCVKPLSARTRWAAPKGECDSSLGSSFESGFGEFELRGMSKRGREL